MKAALNPYDVVAYPGHSYAHTHPNALASMAVLHGLSPAPVERCRVLEIACGDGANLIPMAAAIAGGEFVGFDLAAEPVARGQARIGDLELKNIRLFAGDLLHVGPELGRFDYIIAHGIYTWSPSAVSDRVLALCGELLTENGIAFVSYNTMPGGHLRLMLREMMLYRTQGADDLLEQAKEGMAFLRLVCGSRPENEALGAAVEKQLKRMERRGPRVVRHDEMNDVYEPVYFTQFVERAQRHGLEYLCEAALAPPPDPVYRADIQAELDKASGGDPLRKEQLLDFLRLRMYRETLLCRSGLAVRRDFSAASFRRLLFASQAVSAPGNTPGATAFVLPGGIRMESEHPGVKALLLELAQAWPHALSFDALAPHLEETGFALDSAGRGMLLRLAIARMVELRAWNPPMARRLSERPRATAVSRQQARMGDKGATSLLHQTVSLEDENVRALLRLLDGTRSRAELLQAMIAEKPEQPVAEIESGFDGSLHNFWAAGMLEA